jgi:hypothetical protein
VAYSLVLTHVQPEYSLSTQRSTSQPDFINTFILQHTMRASLFATLLLAVSVIAPALASPIRYVSLPLTPAISADLFVAFATALTLFNAVPHLPHVTRIRTTAMRTRRKTPNVNSLMKSVALPKQVMMTPNPRPRLCQLQREIPRLPTEELELAVCRDIYYTADAPCK